MRLHLNKIRMISLLHYYLLFTIIIKQYQLGMSFFYRLHGNFKIKRFLTRSISVSTSLENEKYKYLMIKDVDNIDKRVRYIDDGDDKTLPTLVIFIGTAQTIDSYVIHKNPISIRRRLIIIELRGQGDTDLDSNQCTIDQYIHDIMNIFNILDLTKVHLCGFSFGARIALAYTSIHPNIVQKLSITGIPYVRPILGKLILQSWIDSLSRGNIIDCAWSLVLNGYSKEYLEKYESKIPLFVQMLVNNNNPNKLYHLIKLSNIHNETDNYYYSIPQCIQRLQDHNINYNSSYNNHNHNNSIDNSNNNIQIQVIGAIQDRIAGYESVQDLASYISNVEFITMDTGHLVPFESPTIWRKHILDFFSK